MYLIAEMIKYKCYNEKYKHMGNKHENINNL